MKIENKSAILRIINKNYKGEMVFPSYDHIEIDGQKFALKHAIMPFLNQNENHQYLEQEILVTGIISHEYGHMPNPMAKCPVFSIEKTK